MNAALLMEMLDVDVRIILYRFILRCLWGVTLYDWAKATKLQFGRFWSQNRSVASHHVT